MEIIILQFGIINIKYRIVTTYKQRMHKLKVRAVRHKKHFYNSFATSWQKKQGCHQPQTFHQKPSKQVTMCYVS